MKLKITALTKRLSKIYFDTQYDFLSMRTKRNPHCLYASGDTRKEESTKRLCSLVDNSQASCKKVPSEKSWQLTALRRDLSTRLVDELKSCRSGQAAGTKQQKRGSGLAPGQIDHGPSAPD